jgi:hypothetical protein
VRAVLSRCPQPAPFDTVPTVDETSLAALREGFVHAQAA